MRAFNDRIIVQKGICPERTKGGIILASGTQIDAKVKLNIGKVLSVGKGIRFSNGDAVIPECNVGDCIMWEQFGEIMAEVLGEGKVAVRWEDVMCALDPDEYEGWYFDPEEYKKYLAEKEKELEEAKKKQRAEQEAAFAETNMYICKNKKCYRVKKSIQKKPSDNLQCEYCGVEMELDEGRKAPMVFVKDGCSPGIIQ